MMKGRFLVLILVIFGLHACSFGTKEKKTPQEEPIVEQQTFVVYEMESIDQKKGPCTIDESSQTCLTIRIDYPLINEGPTNEVLDTINSKIRKDIFNYAFINETPGSFEELIEEISTEYKDVITEFPDYKAAWSLEISSDIIYQTEKFISVATTIFSYTGGAHPNSSLVYKSYDLNSGKAIELEDILIDNYKDELYRSAEIEFRMNHEIPPSRSLSTAGFIFENDEFRLNNNFAIIDNSLVFYFNDYEIASYAQGPSELELKLTDYVNLIDENGVLNDLKN